MSVQASTGLVVSQNAAAPEIVRRTANYHPTIWGDRFSACTYDNLSSDASVEKHIEELKAEVRRKLIVAAERPTQKLNLINAIQRLGLAYHFETEIEKALEQVYHNENNDDNSDLFLVALRFRLLRQHGYHVSCDMFKKFKDNNGNFKEALIGDVPGMLSLYEATHLRVHGEDILDQALDFSATHLQSMANQLSSSPLAAQIIHALKQPIHKGIPRLHTRQYISIYQQEDSHDETLLRLAKLDFNRLQKINQKELCEITKWWKDLDFASKLPFARDRVVEGYFWTLGVYFEPEYYLARRILTKVIAMTSTLDDIYDVYGTIDELELFKEAVERWDTSTIDELPEYMKICYQALLDVYSEIEEEMAKQGRSYRLYYAKEAMKNQVRAYFEEAKWFGVKYVPTMDEYMRVALATSAYFMLSTTSLVGMGDIVTKEILEWAFSEPEITKASSIICRLMDDMMSHNFEQKRGHVASAIECYTKQHGVSEAEACEEFRRQVTNAWKAINQECLQPTAIPMLILTRVLNLARVIDVVYKDGDGYTQAGIFLKDYVSSLLIDPAVL